MGDQHSTALDSIFDELATETGEDTEKMREMFFQRIREPQS